MKNKIKQIVDFIKVIIDRIITIYKDFKFEQITKIEHRNELYNVFRKISQYGYVRWDIVESTIEFLFAQFICFYERYKKQYSQEYLQSYIDEYKNKKYSKEIRKDFYEAYKIRKKQIDAVNNIWKYVTENSAYNREVFDKIIDKCFENFSTEYLKTQQENEFGEYIIKGVKHYNIKYSFDKFGKIIIKESKLLTDKESKKDNTHKLEQAIFDKDSEYAKRIIDIRECLWD